MEAIYRETFPVRAAECDFTGNMRLSALFIAMQEGAEKSAETLGAGRFSLLSRNLFFALSRIHTEMERPPRLGETVVHETWPGVSNHFFYPRFHRFFLEDGTKLVSAAALWVTMDMNERKIVTPSSAGFTFPDTSLIEPPCRLPGKPKEPGVAAESFETRTQYEDLDINGHVNNARYISWLANALGEEAFSGRHIRSLVAGYEKEIRGGHRVTHHLERKEDAFFYRVTDETGAKCFSASGEFASRSAGSREE
ncbi:MAG: hypothetical protein K5746_06290 [Clostridiales bacterium]|nr:hypothetical protein [Clostridiales bacterium]